MVNENGQGPKFERLVDSKFPWIERRKKAVKLAQIYEKAGYILYAERARSCATWLQFQAMGDGTKMLSAANFCALRLCPMCISRRAKRNALKLSKVMDAVEVDKKCRFLFLTLTVQNCDGRDLESTIKALLYGWVKLIRHREIERAAGGWFRALEITRNKKTGQYHPHIHAILAVPPEYFDTKSNLYITQKSWREHWQLACGLDYDPSVRISTTKARGNCDSATRSATVEAAKYATKDSEYISSKLSMKKAVQIVTDYTEALFRKRLTAFGGWMKETAKLFDADNLDSGDLVHVDDDEIRADIAEYVETYNWNFGAGDYILADRTVNPLRIQREGVGSDARLLETVP